MDESGSGVSPLGNTKEQGLVDVSRRSVAAIGGTFDPPHYGHLIGAQEVQAVLGVERVLFVPTGEPPHKIGEPITETQHRVKMTELAIQDNEAFDLCLEDVGRNGPSFTVELIPRLRAIVGMDADLLFLIGMDSLRDLPQWRQPAEILEMCRLVAFSRPGYPPADLEELDRAVPGAADRVILLRAPGVDISSTEIRNRIAQGLPIRYLVPPAVDAYVAQHRLYQEPHRPPVDARRQRSQHRLSPDAF